MKSKILTLDESRKEIKSGGSTQNHFINETSKQLDENHNKPRRRSVDGIAHTSVHLVAACLLVCLRVEWNLEMAQKGQDGIYQAMGFGLKGQS